MKSFAQTTQQDCSLAAVSAKFAKSLVEGSYTKKQIDDFHKLINSDLLPAVGCEVYDYTVFDICEKEGLDTNTSEVLLALIGYAWFNPNGEVEMLLNNDVPDVETWYAQH